MRRFANILAQAIGALFYPLLIPTYGMLLFRWGYGDAQSLLPQVYWWIAIGGTVVLTLIIPLSIIALMIARGQIEDLYINRPEQRTAPYLYSVVCFCFWCYFLNNILHVPPFLVWVAMGATVALGLVLLINRWWKISAHLTAMGGLLGGFLSFYLYYGWQLSPLGMGIWLLLTLALMTARIYVQAHTPLQVVAGWLLGLCMTFIPNLILYYV